VSEPLILRCAACGGINRVQPDRLAQDPICGRCKAAIDPAAHPAPVDDDTLDRLVAACPVPVLVDFWAPWCAPCRMVAPHLEALAKKHAGRLVVVKVDTDRHQRVAARLGVRSIPTLAVWKGGELARSQPGALTGPALDAFVNPYL